MTAESVLNKAAVPETKGVKNENGEIVEEPVKDENGKQKYKYNRFNLKDDDVAALCEKVLPFLKDLADALEEGE
jgi:hypothetical protein